MGMVLECINQTDAIVGAFTVRVDDSTSQLSYP